MTSLKHCFRSIEIGQIPKLRFDILELEKIYFRIEKLLYIFLKIFTLGSRFRNFKIYTKSCKACQYFRGHYLRYGVN